MVCEPRVGSSAALAVPLVDSLAFPTVPHLRRKLDKAEGRLQGNLFFVAWLGFLPRPCPSSGSGADVEIHEFQRVVDRCF